MNRDHHTEGGNDQHDDVKGSGVQGDLAEKAVAQDCVEPVFAHSRFPALTQQLPQRLRAADDLEAQQEAVKADHFVEEN
ncbi:MAG: hypothetical protein FJX77_17125, partial [Armatimonadetes bacterium]|nr:hypothetical protein [Armatimonadota bacterium]